MTADHDTEFGDRGPADEDGHAPGRATPDDVLRGAALEDHRVAHGIHDDGPQREGRGQHS